MNLSLFLIGIWWPFVVSATFVHDYHICSNCCLPNDQQQNASRKVFSQRTDGISNSSSVLGLHTEIQEFYDYMQLTPTEQALHGNVVFRIESLVLQLWPHAIFKPFGSYAWGFNLPTGDIDILVSDVTNTSSLQLLAAKLQENGIAEKNSIKVKENQQMPIIKYIDRDSKIRIEMPFINGEAMARLGKLLGKYRREYPVFAKMITVLKQFLRHRSLNKRHTGGISSYALYFVVIHFLELHPEIKAKDDVNLGALLLDFFELYGQNFDYERIGIRIGNGGKCIPRSELPCGLVDGQFRLFCVEDAICPWQNAASATYRGADITKAFSDSYVTLSIALQNVTNQQNTSIFNRVVSVGDDIFEYRKWIHDNFNSNGIRLN